MKNLAQVSTAEQLEFLDSFDDILADVDGVLWLLLQKIPRTDEAVANLKKLGKKIRYVSNNCTKPYDVYIDQLNKAGFEVEHGDLITPAMAMISHLKSINFSKEVYVVGMNFLKKDIEKAGIKVYDDKTPARVDEDVKALVKQLEDDEKVGAVIIDADINMSFVKLQRAVTFLKRPDVIFIKGATDLRAPVSPKFILIGPGYFQGAVEEISGRKALPLAKPSLLLNNYIKKTYNLKDPSRVLFIGDSVPEDMGFGANCGYKKLLVLSGLTRPEAINKWEWPEEFKPDYYIEHLGVLNDIIHDTQKLSK